MKEKENWKLFSYIFLVNNTFFLDNCGSFSLFCVELIYHAAAVIYTEWRRMIPGEWWLHLCPLLLPRFTEHTKPRARLAPRQETTTLLSPDPAPDQSITTGTEYWTVKLWQQLEVETRRFSPKNLFQSVQTFFQRNFSQQENLMNVWWKDWVQQHQSESGRVYDEWRGGRLCWGGLCREAGGEN